MDVDDAGVTLAWTRGALKASADETFTWPARRFLKSPESLSVALETVRALIEHRPVVRAQCWRSRWSARFRRARAGTRIRLVSQRLHGVRALAAGIEGSRCITSTRRARRVSAGGGRDCEKASESPAAKEKSEAERRAIEAAGNKAEAEGAHMQARRRGRTKVVGHRGGGEEEGGGGGGGGGGGAGEDDVGGGGRRRARHREARRALLRAVQPQQLSCPGCLTFTRSYRVFAPAVVEGVAFDSLSARGPACDAGRRRRAPRRRRDAGAQGGGDAGGHVGVLGG